MLNETQIATRDVLGTLAQDQIRPKVFEHEAARAYLEEFGLAKIHRDVRVCQIYQGTSDIQRLVIARSL